LSINLNKFLVIKIAKITLFVTDRQIFVYFFLVETLFGWSGNYLYRFVAKLFRI